MIGVTGSPHIPAYMENILSNYCGKVVNKIFKTANLKKLPPKNIKHCLWGLFVSCSTAKKDRFINLKYVKKSCKAYNCINI